MKVLLRPVMATLAFVFSSVGVVLAAPQFVEDFSTDLWSYFENERTVRQNAKEFERLEQAGERVKTRLNLKISLTRDLADERISLAQAIDQFLELNYSDPEIMSETRKLYPAASDEECVALQVLAFVQVELSNTPSESAIVLEQIRSQFKQMQFHEASGVPQLTSTSGVR